MKVMYRSFIFIALCWMSASAAQAQADTDSTAMWQITTRDGNTYLGVIEEQNDEMIRLRTENLGVLTIRRSDVKTMRKVPPERIRNEEYWPENPQSARYFWAPNGYALKKGEGYYQNVWVLFNQLSYGVSDNFSIGIGGVPLFLFGGAATPIWITPKISFPLQPDQVNFGAGALIGGVVGAESNNGVFGVTYGVLTLGSRDKNFNVGFGYGFSEGQWAQAPAITIGAMIRASRRSYIITENYYIGDKADHLYLLSLGGRFVGNSITVDYGGILPIYDTVEFMLPWLGIVVPLGQARD